MWELREFDRNTSFLKQDYSLPQITTERIQELLGLGDTVEIGDHHYPLEAGGYDVPESLVSFIATFGNWTGLPQPGMDYQVAYFEQQ